MPRGPRIGSGAPERSLRRDRLVALLLIACVLVATVGAWAVARSRENRDATRGREREAAELAQQLQTGYAQTQAVLSSANALVDANGDVDVQRFQIFAQVILAPGLAGALAYEPVVPDDQRALFESHFGFAIVDRAPDGSYVKAPQRSVYFPVAAVTPNDEIPRRNLGFDIAQDPSRGDTARLARDQGVARITPFVPLAPSNRPGFLLVLPLKRPDGQVAGFITVTYLGENVGQSIVAGLRPGTRLSVIDQGTELFRTADAPHGHLAQSL
jgi:CHASE1-domain containing sensor protein